MHCCVTELRDKEVINKDNGCRLGNVSDVEINTCDGKVVALLIYGRAKLGGIMGRCEDIRICWEDVDVIGDDIILVHYKSPPQSQPRKNGNFLNNMFH